MGGIYMFKLLRLGIYTASVLVLALLFACEGDTGPQGPQGDPGEPGEPGEDLAAGVPEDFYFSVALFNEDDGTASNYRAKDFVRVTFDTLQEADASTVVGVKLDTPPRLDGEDGDIDEWSPNDELYESDVVLESIVGVDNEISQIQVRAAYDAEFIYMFFMWTEDWVVNDIDTVYEISENRHPEEWFYRFDGSEGDFNQEGVEDRLWVMFITGDYVPTESDNLLEGGLGTASFGSDVRIDVWDWRAGATDLVGFADDAYMVYSGGSLGAITGDVGGSCYMENNNNGEPIWMHFHDPNYDADYPFWLRDAVMLADTSSFTSSATIPGYVSLVPYGDRGQVFSGSSYFILAGLEKWAVELKRIRRTGSGNDRQF